MTLSGNIDSTYQSSFLPNFTSSERSSYDDAIEWSLRLGFPEECIVSGDNYVTVYQPQIPVDPWDGSYEQVGFDYVPYESTRESVSDATTRTASKIFLDGSRDIVNYTDEYSSYTGASYSIDRHGVSNHCPFTVGNAPSVQPSSYAAHPGQIYFWNNEIPPPSRSSTEDSAETVLLAHGRDARSGTSRAAWTSVPVEYTSAAIANSTQRSLPPSYNDDSRSAALSSEEPSAAPRLNRNSSPISPSMQGVPSNGQATGEAKSANGALWSQARDARPQSAAFEHAQRTPSLPMQQYYSAVTSSPGVHVRGVSCQCNLACSGVECRSIAVGSGDLQPTPKLQPTLEQEGTLSVISTALESPSQRSVTEFTKSLTSPQLSNLELDPLSVLEAAVGSYRSQGDSKRQRFSSTEQEMLALITSKLNQLLRSINEVGDRWRSSWQPSPEQQKVLAMTATAIRRNLDSVTEESDTEAQGLLSADEPHSLSNMASTVNEILKSVSEDGDESVNSGCLSFEQQEVISTISSAINDILLTQQSKRNTDKITEPITQLFRVTLSKKALTETKQFTSENNATEGECPLQALRPTMRPTEPTQHTSSSGEPDNNSLLCQPFHRTVTQEVKNSTSEDFCSGCKFPSATSFSFPKSLKATSKENVINCECLSNQEGHLNETLSDTNTYSITIKSKHDESESPSQTKRASFDPQRRLSSIEMSGCECTGQRRKRNSSRRSSVCSKVSNALTSEEDLTKNDITKSKHSTVLRSSLRSKRSTRLTSSRKSSPSSVASERISSSQGFASGNHVKSMRPQSSIAGSTHRKTSRRTSVRFVDTQGSASDFESKMSNVPSLKISSRVTRASETLDNCPTESPGTEGNEPCEERLTEGCLLQEQCTEVLETCKERPILACPVTEECAIESEICEQIPQNENYHVEIQCIAGERTFMECPVNPLHSVEKESNDHGIFLHCPIDVACQVEEYIINEVKGEKCPIDTSRGIQEQSIENQKYYKKYPHDESCQVAEECLEDDGLCSKKVLSVTEITPLLQSLVPSVTQLPATSVQPPYTCSILSSLICESPIRRQPPLLMESPSSSRNCSPPPDITFPYSCDGTSTALSKASLMVPSVAKTGMSTLTLPNSATMASCHSPLQESNHDRHESSCESHGSRGSQGSHVSCVSRASRSSAASHINGRNSAHQNRFPDVLQSQGSTTIPRDFSLCTNSAMQTASVALDRPMPESGAASAARLSSRSRSRCSSVRTTHSVAHDSRNIETAPPYNVLYTYPMGMDPPEWTRNPRNSKGDTHSASSTKKRERLPSGSYDTGREISGERSHHISEYPPLPPLSEVSTSSNVPNNHIRAPGSIRDTQSNNNQMATRLGSHMASQVENGAAFQLESQRARAIGSQVASQTGNELGSESQTISQISGRTSSGLVTVMRTELGSVTRSQMGSVKESDSGEESGNRNRMGSEKGSGEGSGKSSRMGSGLSSRWRSGMGSGMWSGMGLGMGSGLAREIGSGMGRGMVNELGTRISSGMGGKMATSIGSRMAGRINTALGKNMSSGMSSGIGTETGSKMAIGTSSEVASVKSTKVGSEMGYGVSSGISNVINKGMGNGMSKRTGDGMTKELSSGTAKGLNSGMAKGMGNGITKGMSSEVNNGMGKGMAKGMGNGKAKEMDSEITNGVSSRIDREKARWVSTRAGRDIDRGIGNGTGDGMSTRMSTEMTKVMASKLGSEMVNELGGKMAKGIDRTMNNDMGSGMGKEVVIEMTSGLSNGIGNRMGSGIGNNMNSQPQSRLASGTPRGSRVSQGASSTWSGGIGSGRDPTTIASSTSGVPLSSVGGTRSSARRNSPRPTRVRNEFAPSLDSTVFPGEGQAGERPSSQRKHSAGRSDRKSGGMSWAGHRDPSKARTSSAHQSQGSPSATHRSSSVPVRAATSAERQAISILAASINNENARSRGSCFSNVSRCCGCVNIRCGSGRMPYIYPAASVSVGAAVPPIVSTTWTDDFVCRCSSSKRSKLQWQSSLEAQSAFQAAEAATAAASSSWSGRPSSAGPSVSPRFGSWRPERTVYYPSGGTRYFTRANSYHGSCWRQRTPLLFDKSSRNPGKRMLVTKRKGSTRGAHSSQGNGRVDCKPSCQNIVIEFEPDSQERLLSLGDVSLSSSSSSDCLCYHYNYCCQCGRSVSYKVRGRSTSLGEHHHTTRVQPPPRVTATEIVLFQDHDARASRASSSPKGRPRHHSRHPRIGDDQRTLVRR